MLLHIQSITKEMAIYRNGILNHLQLLINPVQSQQRKYNYYLGFNGPTWSAFTPGIDDEI